MTRSLSSRRLFRRLRDTRGNTMIEAAIITPLLLLLTFGIMEFAAMFYVYLALENGVAQATPTLTIPDSAFSFSNLPVGDTTWVAGAGGPGTIQKITVNYTWTFMTPLIRPFFTGGQLNMQVDSSMKNEAAFN